jgi:hypothetical protein
MIISGHNSQIPDEWKTYYEDLDIPQDWKNSSYSNDELPSFTNGDYIIHISKPNMKNRFHIMEVEDYLGNFHDEDNPPITFAFDSFEEAKLMLKQLYKSKAKQKAMLEDLAKRSSNE